MQRDYTGFADADAPTTLGRTIDRSAQLRPDDPSFFETRFDWNRCGQMTRELHPNGNITLFVHQGDLDPNSPWRSRGNLRALKRLPGSHTPIGDQPALVELFEYDEGMGGCCGSNFVTKHNGRTRKRDRARLRLLGQSAADSPPDRLHRRGLGVQRLRPSHQARLSHGGRREPARGCLLPTTVPADGHQNGYLKDVIVDAMGEALTTHLRIRRGGQLAVRVTDPRGNDTLFTFNQLDQVVRETSREVTDGSGLRYRT